MNFFTKRCRALLVCVVVLVLGLMGCDSMGDALINEQVKNSNGGGGTSETSGSFTDSRNGQKYKMVKIGNQTWMAENLNIPKEDSWCYGEGGQVYDSEREEYVTLSSNEVQSNCAKYGRLYTWEAAMSACPTGWRLPTRSDWDVLAETVGGQKVELVLGPEEHSWDYAGKALKSTSGWYGDGNGTNTSGFAALPSGSRRYDGNFYNAGRLGHWWTATERGNDGGSYYGRAIRYDYDFVLEFDGPDGLSEYSVRCIAD